MPDKLRDARYRLTNEVETFATTNFGPVWRSVQRVRILERAVNRGLINSGINTLPARPYRLSTKGDFTSWDSLTDKTYNTRELPPAPGPPRKTPDARKVMELFRREEFIECPKSTVLFAYVAQWFTDGFLRSDRSIEGKDERDITRNESTHEVDLAQLYGLTTEITETLRHESDRSLLAHQVIDGEEYPPAIFDVHGERVAQFKDMRMIGTKQQGVDLSQLLAMGSDTSNTQLGYAMLNTLFLREHNRIARELARANPDWDENQLFAAARAILTVLLIKVVIEEYINHITPYHFLFRFDPSGFRKQPWMRTNWVAVEFNLLYRWHSLIPSTLQVGGRARPLLETTFQSRSLLTEHGLGKLFDEASRQRAGRVGLRNTDDWLVDKAELPSIEAGRKVKLRSYNDYLEHCKFPRATSFEQISRDPRTQAALEDTYGDVDEVEFFVGLFAEDARKNSVVPPLMGRLVGIHAFSQLMTNPLLGPEIYNEKTFSKRGMQIIDDTKSLKQVLQRNVPEGSPDYMVKMTREGWTRG